MFPDRCRRVALWVTAIVTFFSLSGKTPWTRLAAAGRQSTGDRVAPLRHAHAGGAGTWSRMATRALCGVGPLTVSIIEAVAGEWAFLVATLPLEPTLPAAAANFQEGSLRR